MSRRRRGASGARPAAAFLRACRGTYRRLSLRQESRLGRPSVYEIARFGHVAAVGLEDPLQGVLHVDLRAPGEVLQGVGDLRYAVLHVLVALAVVLVGRGRDQLYLAGIGVLGNT